ncbi:COMM domain-containing protein 8 isoform X1 [Bufo gargarizans]|uniref:COMM domain-containing protein 8 isoform X1 n=1 Tax=Bufo gargarizans TaxID=30331 RepID=UPI001CF5715C|nr:COMM domain-containing protein 8 isoform X1 [Bufo gargarizans]
MDGAEERGLGLIVKLPLAQCPQVRRLTGRVTQGVLGFAVHPQFLHKVIDGVCGRAQPRFQDYGSIWNLREWLEVLEDITAFIKITVGKDGASDEISKELSGLNPEYQEMMIRCMTSRRPEIKDALVERACAMSSAYLKDFDWQLKLAMSSDKLSTLQMPLVNLDLDIVENGAIAPASIEMTKEELQNLINSLEAANKVVLQLK